MKKPSNFIQKGLLRVAKGDGTNPTGSSMQYIIQICNNSGTYETENTKALAKRYPKVVAEYRSLWRNRFGKLALGEIQIIQLRSDVAVINLIAQDCTKLEDDKIEIGPINLKALQVCLDKAGVEISDNSASAHMPRITDWAAIEPIIEAELLKRGINVTVYDG
jgi:hypothetical protein